MENNEVMAQLDKLFEDDSFNQSVADATSAEEIRELFSQKDVKISVEDAGKILSQLSKIKNGDTLTEEDLDQVAGGFGTAVLFVAGVAACIAVGYLTFRIGKWIVDRQCR